MNPILKLLLTLCLVSFGSYAQAKSKKIDAELLTIPTQDKRFVAVLNGRIGTTVYVKHHKNSEYHGNVHSVKGWYYYNQYEKKIALVGYEAFGNLYLFQTDNKDFEQKILNMEFPWSEYMNDEVAEKNKSGWNEYLLFHSEGVEKSLWTNKKKELTLEGRSEDFHINEVKQYLALNFNGKKPVYFDMTDFGTYHVSNSRADLGDVVAVDLGNEVNVLLSFDYPSNPNANGRCGAGHEKGFMQMTLNKDLHLESLKEVLLESCYQSVEIENEKQFGRNIHYQVDNDGKSQLIILDKGRASIEVRER